MSNQIENKLKEVREYISGMEELERAVALIYWDMKICMPQNALEQRAKTMSYISGEIFKRSVSDKVKEFIEFFKPIMNELSIVDQAMIRELTKNYDNTKKIPEQRFMEFQELVPLSSAAWEEAKEKNDFKIFEPYLEKVVAYERDLAGYLGYEDNKYDALLGQYEEGITVSKLDKVFGELRDGIIELLDYTKNSDKINKDFLNQKFPIEKQKELSSYLLDVMHFDKNSGRLDETVHPFTINFGNKDVRITTHYYENDFLSNMYSVIHEGGHALYELGIDDNLLGTGLAGASSMGIHESQSRFYENIVGRSREFLSSIFPQIKEIFENLNDVNFDDFYKAVNCIEPSLIRTEADELTYSLHVIIRYEIEKELINEEIEVKDLPRVWNEKYIKYLGVEPKTDAEGILQDMHWSDGSFGYFPSYALGNVYGGQLLHKLLKDNNDVFSNIKNGDLVPVNNWLKENVHRHGAIYTPTELIKKITGEELSTKYFLEYLNKKYRDIY